MFLKSFLTFLVILFSVTHAYAGIVITSEDIPLEENMWWKWNIIKSGDVTDSYNITTKIEKAVTRDNGTAFLLKEQVYENLDSWNEFYIAKNENAYLKTPSKDYLETLTNIKVVKKTIMIEFPLFIGEKWSIETGRVQHTIEGIEYEYVSTIDYTVVAEENIYIKSYAHKALKISKNWHFTITEEPEFIAFPFLQDIWVVKDLGIVKTYCKQDLDGNNRYELIEETTLTDYYIPSKTDSDNDGIMDSVDICPDTPGTPEVADSTGCSPSQKDTDSDGVSDKDDQCPNTPPNEPTDNAGCSSSQKDTDNDSLTDDKDLCPNTPVGEKIDITGCSPSQKDTDSDGVSDKDDQCPNTPPNEPTDNAGCTPSQKDTDNDSLTDDKDLCPNTPAGEKININGCSDSQLDDDKDGVFNNIDTELDTPTGCTVNSQGVSLDIDLDGICNAHDKCTDVDKDGYTVEGSACNTLPDCNDYVFNIHPGALDSCGDGIDQNCDGFNPLCFPEITPLSTPQGYHPGEHLTVTATITDADSPTFRAWLAFRPTNSPATTAGIMLEMSNYGGNEWTITIPRHLLPINGIDYHISATDNHGNNTRTETVTAQALVPTLGQYGIMILVLLISISYKKIMSHKTARQACPDPARSGY